MRRIAFFFFAYLCIFMPADAGKPASLFTAEEKQWMAMHPVVYYNIDPAGYPLEYLDKQQHKGLTKEYIDVLARITGLEFRLYPVPLTSIAVALKQVQDGQIQLLPAVADQVLREISKNILSYSHPYYAGGTVIVTQPNAPIIFSSHGLDGKIVAIRHDSDYTKTIQSLFPGIHILPVDNIEQALDAVATGDAYATISADIVVRSLLQRKYGKVLSIAGDVEKFPILMTMGVSNAEPLLLSIINKSLSTLTAQQTDTIYADWLATIDYGAPPLRSIVHYYASELLVLVLGMALLVLFAQRASTAQRRAQRSEAEKSMFLAVMSHEIRTPMNAVLASIELLNRTNLDGEQKELAALANSSSVNLLELLDDILHTSKLGAKRLELDLRPTDMTSLAQGVADSNRLRAQSKGLLLTLSLSGLEGIALNLDPMRMRQILSNLLSNAVKFTEQGEITLDVRLDNVKNDQGQLILTVQDSGIGITEEQQTHLFQPFSQADKSTTRQYGGSGLGLMISKQLVELMGGTIQLHSTLGKGTQITVTLPVDVLDYALLPLAKEVSTVTMNRLPVATSKILIVDDQPTNQFIIERQLKELGYRATIVGDGKTVLDILKGEHQFAIALLDCYMPDMDGYELARRIRRHEQENHLARLPLIAISATTGEEHLTKCVDSGMDGTLSKPLSLNALQKLLRLWLPVPLSRLAVDNTEQQLAALQQTIVQESQQSFQASCRDDIAALRTALEQKDLSQAVYYAHRLHGVALMSNATSFAHLANTLEDELRNAADAFSRWREQLEEMQRIFPNVEGGSWRK